MVASKTTAKKRGIEETKSSKSKNGQGKESPNRKRQDSDSGKTKRPRHDRPDYNFTDYPLGLKFLIFFCASSALLFILLAITYPYIMYFGLNIEGWPAVAALLVSALAYLAVFYGIVSRKRWAVAFTISWYVLNMVSSIVSMFFIDKTMLGLLYDFFMMGLIVTSIVNVLVAWYVFHKREFFFDDALEKDHFQKKHFTTVDKVFIFIVSIFVLSCLVIGGVVAFNTFSKLSGSIATYGPRLSEFRMIEDAVMYCSGVDDPDLCLLSFSVMSQKEQKGTELVKVCEGIKSPFLRYTCFDGLNVR